MGDRDFKVVGRLRPLDLLGLVPGPPIRGTARSVDKEVAAAPQLPRLLDQIVEIEELGGALTSFQLEFESEPQSDTGKRVFEHWALSQRVLGRDLRCVVFYMAKGKGRRRPQRRYVVRCGATALRFSFEAICLWEVDVDALLAPSVPGLWPLAPLGRGASVEHAERACRLLEGLDDESLSSELLGVWYEVAGMKVPQADLMAMVRRKELLMESATYKAIKEEGRLEGIEEGIERSRADLAGKCLRAVTMWLGSLPPEAAAIESLDWDRLSQLNERLLAAASPEAVREALRDLE
jgi:hypothetical protein